MRSSTFGLEEEVVLAYSVVTGVSPSIAVGADEVDFGVTVREDLFLVLVLLICCFWLHLLVLY